MARVNLLDPEALVNPCPLKRQRDVRPCLGSLECLSTHPTLDRRS